MRTVHSAVAVVAFAIASLSNAADLSKSDAAKLLSSMGNKNVVVGAVVQGIGDGGFGAGGIGVGGGGDGFGANSSQSSALVIGYAERDGKPKSVRQTFLYDKDLGWFFSEVDIPGKRVRVWTVQGYKEFRPTN